MTLTYRYQMHLIKLDMDKEIAPSRPGNLKHYLERPSAIPVFLDGALREIERWLSMLGDMERYKVHEKSPGRQWMDSLVEQLKVSIVKMTARKKKPGPVQLRLLVPDAAANETKDSAKRRKACA